jgi:hypothetical protein
MPFCKFLYFRKREESLKKMVTSYPKKIISGLVFFVLFLFSFFTFTQSAFALALDPALPVTTCGEISTPGDYDLANNVGTTSQTCFTITSEGVNIRSTSTSRTILGNIVASTITNDTDGACELITYRHHTKNISPPWK